MDTIISARVPVEIKKRGDKRLKEIGSSITELVNSAYAFLLETGELPQTKEAPSAEAPLVKTLSGDSAEAFRTQWASRAVLENDAYDGSNFKALLDKAREDYYARLA